MRLTVRVGSVKTCEKVAVADWLAVIVATQVVAVPRHLRPAEVPSFRLILPQRLSGGSGGSLR